MYSHSNKSLIHICGGGYVTVKGNLHCCLCAKKLCIPTFGDDIHACEIDIYVTDVPFIGTLTSITWYYQVASYVIEVSY